MPKTVGPKCEAKIDGVWMPMSLLEARGKYRLAPKRCPICHGAGSIMGSYTALVKHRLTHRRMHTGCPLIPKAYCGTSSPHPNAAT
ncbi:hypothetical protein FV232_04775 [Methylobacterium sp. WL30]|nr:hypothetical protein FV225_02185 [Methylobacterium sp. WL93]TXN52425.1 hypothetical protein FV227_02995 [Methylobacterium sp. WL119]TXN69770.1 hypothetical protein FV232_04775 [Methylobacterium sp. WL30]